MPDTPSVATLINQHDLPALAAHDPKAVHAHTIAELADQETTHPAIDADGLISLGVTLHLAGHQRTDLAVTEWLHHKRSLARLDLASLLLTGLWRSGRTAPAVHPDALRELIDSYTELSTSDIDDGTKYSYRTALDNAITATENTEDQTAAIAQKAMAELSDQ